MNNKKAYTLIEVLGGIVLLAIAVTPLMILIRSTILSSLRQEQGAKVLYYAQEKMEEEIAYLEDNFLRNPTPDGVIESQYRFHIEYTQDSGTLAPSLIPLDDLKIITVTVWFDENNDGSLDAQEQHVTLNTKHSRK